MRISILLVLSLAACTARESNLTTDRASRGTILQTCASEPVCIGYHVLTVSPAAFSDAERRIVLDAVPLVAESQLALDLAIHMSPAREVVEAAGLAPRSPSSPMVRHFARGIATGQIHDGVALAILDGDVDQRAKQHVAGGLISLGAPYTQSFTVLQNGLLSNDRAVVMDAAAVVEQVAPAIPNELRPVFASLLREQGQSAAFLH
jgi:hypothetical protein